METTTHQPSSLRPLSAELQEIAQRELNEVPDRVAADVAALRVWLEYQPHLRARSDPQFLVSFLRGSKFSLEKAKQKIDRYYSLRAAIPEVFNDRRTVDHPQVLEIVRLGVILQLPLPAEETGPCITIIRAGSYDTDRYKFADIVRVGSMFGDIMMLEDDNANVSGYMEIMDMTHVSGTHFFQLQPELLKKFSVFADEAMPMRQRGTHFINVPPPFEKGFNSLRSFFPAKAMSRISVNSDPDAIYQYVPRHFLPLEYGGDNGCIQDIVDRMECKLKRYRDFFNEEQNYGSDEKLREGKSFHYDSCFGIDGSFRSLDID